MNVRDKRHIAIFLLGATIAFYLFSAVWSAIFIIELDHKPGWCQEWVEFQSGPNSYKERCVDFKDDAEEIKYYHNLRMVGRNKYWIYATVALGGAIGAFAFHIVPRWRGNQTSSTTFGGGIAIGVIAAFIGPMVLSLILPAPARWFPQEFLEIHEARQDAALEKLGIDP